MCTLESDDDSGVGERGEGEGEEGEGEGEEGEEEGKEREEEGEGERELDELEAALLELEDNEPEGVSRINQIQQLTHDDSGESDVEDSMAALVT